MSAVYVSLYQLWVRLSPQAPCVCVTVSAVSETDLQAATCHCVSCVCVTVSAVSETDLQAATCHCVSCVYVTVSREWDRPSSSYMSLCQLCMCHSQPWVRQTFKQLCHCVSCGWDCPFKHPFVCVTVSAVYVSLWQLWGRLSFQALCVCHCVSCVSLCQMWRRLSFQAPCVCHCVSCVCVNCEWDWPSSTPVYVSLCQLCMCHCVTSEWDWPSSTLCMSLCQLCVTVSDVRETVPSSTLCMSLCQLCMCHCVSCEWDWPSSTLCMCYLCMCNCVSCEWSCPFKHPFACVTVSAVYVTLCQLWGRLSLQALCVCVTVSAVYVSLCQLWGRLSLQTPLCMRHYVSCVCVIVLTVFIYEWLFTKMFICCCNLMFHDWSECVISVLGTTKHSSCNCIDTWQ